MDLSILLRCQNLLRAGYDSIQSSGPEWLKSLCGEFHKFCIELQTFLATIDTRHQSAVLSSPIKVIDDCLLCCDQIVNCLGWLEQTIRVESTEKRVLSICRQHFLDRITWCIDILIKSVNASNVRPNEMDMDFVTSMDYALELIEPLTMFGNEDVDPVSGSDTNVAATQAEAMLTGQRIRAVVNTLIGHALTFANVALNADRKPLTTVCQTVLKQCIAFEQSTNLDRTLPCAVTAQMCATALENALYQLDGLLNDCLLRLVYAAFAELAQRPLQRLRRLIASAAAQDAVDEHILRFDEMSDRLQQIGTYAAAFASSQSIRTRIRSALASAESLDSVLIAAMLAPSSTTTTIDEPNVALLQRHWTHEMRRLQLAVQSVIDTRAFCDSLYDQLTAVIGEQQRLGDRRTVHAWLDNCGVLLQHLHANRAELRLIDGTTTSTTANGRMLLYNDLGLMLDECRAAADACEANEWRRVVKRLQILQHVLKRFCGTLDDDVAQSESGNARSVLKTDPFEQVNPVDKDALSAELFLREAGISSRVSSVLYESGRGTKGVGSRSVSRSVQMAVVAPPVKIDSGCPNDLTGKSSRLEGKSSSGKRRLTKKSSLRTTLFKRLPLAAPEATNSSSKTSLETSSVVDLNQSLDLHITDILEQITDLSNTLSNQL